MPALTNASADGAAGQQGAAERLATILATQLLNMGKDRTVSDSQGLTPKPNKISRIDMRDDLLG
jgi:hypothetical protein